MLFRRLLLIALVAATLWLAFGCASYETRPMAERGTVLLTWEVDPSRVPGNHCGWAVEIAKGHWLVTFRRAYGFDHICWPHELAHAFGADHAEGK